MAQACPVVSDPFLSIHSVPLKSTKNTDPSGMGADLPLKTLEVLILDCQTTGSRPEYASLIEVGWIRTSAAMAVAPDQPSVVSCLVQLPSNQTVPPPVVRLTGITDTDLVDGWSIDAVWRQLNETAQSVAGANLLQRCPLVIHFARFEKPFLQHLYKIQGAESTLPFDIICSHEIARRLLPELPRKGLRALAGYFGHTVASNRRCAAHATATAVIWRRLVTLLNRSHGVRTLSELKSWLARTPVPTAVRRYPMPPAIRRNLPDDPGVYRLLRSNGDLLYIGKATRLRQRVNHHFRKTGRHSEKSLEMLTQAADVKITITGSALEAALLESEEIKRFCPPYNIALQADNRRTWFMSADFEQFSHLPDRQHRLGPVLHRRGFAALRAIGNILANPSASLSEAAIDDSAVLLDLPERFCPKEASLLEGIGLFMERHATARQSKPLWRTLLAIGDMKRRLAKSAFETDKEPIHGGSEETQISADNVQWTSEGVADRIESLLGQCAWMLRRARWLTLLSESSLMWASRRETIIGLVISGGQVVDRFERAKGDVPPVSPHYHRGTLARQRRIDLWTYDRLRVLLTELRRLSAADRAVCLRLSKRRILRETCLSEALQRV